MGGSLLSVECFGAGGKQMYVWWDAQHTPAGTGGTCPEDAAVKQKQHWRQVGDCIKILKNNSNF